MRHLSDAFIADYVAREWDQIRWTVGCYEVEGAGVQLFEKVEGDPWQLGGTLVVAPGDRIVYRWRNANVDDDAPIDDVIAALARSRS